MYIPDYTLIFPPLLAISPIAAAFLRGRRRAVFPIGGCCVASGGAGYADCACITG